MSVHIVTKMDQLRSICAQNKAVVVDFHATWCGPCKAIAPYVHKQCHEKGLTLVTVDVDQAEEVAAAYYIQAMPTFKVLNNKAQEILGVVGGGNQNVDKIVNCALSNK